MWSKSSYKDTNNLFLLSHENPLEERFWCKSYIFLLFYNTFYFQTYIYFNLSKNLKAIQKQKNSFVKNCLNLFQWKGNFANTYIDLLNIQHLIETLFQFFILLIWTKYNTLFLYLRNKCKFGQKVRNRFLQGYKLDYKQ